MVIALVSRKGNNNKLAVKNQRKRGSRNASREKQSDLTRKIGGKIIKKALGVTALSHQSLGNRCKSGNICLRKRLLSTRRYRYRPDYSALSKAGVLCEDPYRSKASVIAAEKGVAVKRQQRMLSAVTGSSAMEIADTRRRFSGPASMWSQCQPQHKNHMNAYDSPALLSSQETGPSLADTESKFDHLQTSHDDQLLPQESTSKRENNGISDTRKVTEKLTLRIPKIYLEEVETGLFNFSI